MARNYMDMGMQTDCMEALAWFYTIAPPILFSSSDCSAVYHIFHATQRFNHVECSNQIYPQYDFFFRALMYLFSSLMLHSDKLDFLCGGYVNVIVLRMQHIVQTPPVEPRDELLYTQLSKILRHLAMLERTRAIVACPSIKLALEAGMRMFPQNGYVHLAAFNLFRLVFFPLSDVRRAAPALSTVAMVLNAMTKNPNEHLLHVECMLTLDVLTNSRQVLNFVSEQNGVNIVNHTLFCIIGRSDSSAAKIKMALQFPHTLQSEFVLAGFSLLSKLPLRENIIDCIVVNQILRQHKTEIAVQTLGLYVLDKYMLPYPDLYRSFRLGHGLTQMQSAMELPDLSPPSRAIAQKILRVCF